MVYLKKRVGSFNVKATDNKMVFEKQKIYTKPSIVKMAISGTLGGKAKNETEASKLGKIS